ncbi:hypothetical protein PSAL_009530 [Pseudooceanicola algae]|uniref:Uncharacterized protein n=2 Tax=Pseudooceanicola algae TaxID=1537215 RepID=A0A418SEJ0_9RHOB|nr:hypothetical protein PSAL_009530 [Pseudooceanicola algae]
MGLSKIRIAIRLPIAFLLLVAISLGVLGLYANSSAKNTLLEAGESDLLDVAQTQARAMEAWANEVETDLLMQAQSPLLVNALRAFSAGWQVMGPTAADQILRLYVTDSPLPPFQRAALEDAGDGSVYSRAHARFHNHFRFLMKRGGYRDIYLVDASGNILYSAAKQDDFAQNIGNAGQNPFYQMVAGALSSGSQGEASFVDFFEYSTSAEQSSFLVAPISGGDGKILGAIAYRITAATLTGQIGESAGLGETGQSFAIGYDGVARTKAQGWHNDPLPLDTPLRDTLGTGGGIIETDLPMTDLKNQLTAFAPVEVFSADWISIASKNRAEILASVANHTTNSLIFGALILAVTAAIGLVIAMGVSLPLRDVAQCIEDVCDDNYDIMVPHTDRADEIGDIGRSLEQLRERLSEIHLLTHQMSFKSAALEATSAALMITDDDFTITFMNEAVKKMMRVRVEDFQTVLSTFDPDRLIGTNMDRFHAKPDMIRGLIERPDQLPFRTDMRVGSAHIQIEINAVWNDQNAIAGLVVEWVDVTEERRKTAVLNAIEGGQIMAEFEISGATQQVNENFLALTSMGTDTITGVDFADFLRMEEGELDRAAILETAKRGDVIQGKFLVKCQNGSDAIVDGGIYPVLDRRQETSGITLICTDVTAAHLELQAAETRQKAMQEAQKTVVEALRVGMRDITNGDLTSRLQEPFDVEYEQLRKDFNAALENLTHAMRNISGETTAMHQETAEIVRAADEMSVRTERQAVTLQETAASLDELTANISQTAEGAAKANEVVTEARASAESSGTVVDEAESAMAEIAASSHEIRKVISVIDDISFQTNLLALNAGVEAARAGEAGRGFAVVATEVRALAQRCANAAAEINQLITVSGQHVTRGVELVGVTGGTLKTIVSSISDISSYIAEIAQAGKEQSIGLAQVNSAVNQIDHVTQQNAAMFEETTSASHALAQRATRLTETIGHFQIGTGNAQVTLAPQPSGRPQSQRLSLQGNLAVSSKERSEANDWEDF